MSLLKYVLIFIISLTLFSCDEVPVVIPDSGGGGGPISGDTTVRVVLLQELTGVKCPNCPSGAAEAKRLLDVYGDQLAVVAIHGDFLTEPLPESLYDFRTSFSKTIENNTPFIGKPAASINRRLFNGPPFLAFDIDEWEPFVQSELDIPAEMDIQLDVSATMANTLNITVTVDITALDNLSDGYNIAVALTQGGIEDVQEEGNIILEDYEHEHVLRHMFTAPMGDILGSDLMLDQKISKTYTFTTPGDASPAYDIDHLEVVAYITKDGATESPVVQAAKAHF